MSARLLRIIGRLPVPLQDFAYLAIERSAQFIVLIMVIPVVAIAFTVATVVVAILSAVTGLSMSSPLGSVIAIGWFASWTVLPIVITVQMWRSIPALQDLVRMASRSIDDA